MEAEELRAQELQPLLNRALEGDEDAFETLWCRYLEPRKVFPYALKLLKNRSDAEDLTQDIFVHLFDHKHYCAITSRDMPGFTRYVCVMVYNMALDLFRKRKHTRFIITAHTLEQLRLSAVAEEIVVALDSIRKVPVGRTKFIDMLKDTLAEKFSRRMQTIILKYSRYEYAHCEPLTKTPANHMLDDSRNPHKEAEHQELRRMAEELRHILSVDEWDILQNAYSTADFSVPAYSRQTGIPASTLYSRLERAREKVLRHKPLQDYWTSE